MRRQVRFLGVHFPELDVAQSQPYGFFTSQGKQSWRQVGRHNQATRSHSARSGKRWLAETGSDIQYSVPRTDPGQLDEAVIDGLSVSRPHIPVTLPAAGGHSPLVA
jgi:hypothetical protein